MCNLVFYVQLSVLLGTSVKVQLMLSSYGIKDGQPAKFASKHGVTWVRDGQPSPSSQHSLASCLAFCLLASGCSVCMGKLIL